jgi:hypothetical protein
MRDQKRSMRPHEKGLAALYAFLIGIITLRAIRADGSSKRNRNKRSHDTVPKAKHRPNAWA